MESYKLDANGKVVIPISNGNKKITVNEINDQIHNIPDTNSIDVNIESKQGLLPPARVTPKNEYPYSTTMNQGWENTMMGVPLGCNGFIPDYIDTTNLTSGDKVYIVDPKHDDTSKYVLSENKTWSYAGNYNDPEIGGVEGVDYSNIASELGGMWLIRQNPKDGEDAVSFEMKRKTNLRTQRGDVISRTLQNDDDMVFWSVLSTGLKICTMKLENGKRVLSTYVSLSAYSDLEQYQNIISASFGNQTGVFKVNSSRTEIEWVEGTDSGDQLNDISQKIEIYEGDATGTNRVKSNLIYNPCEHEIFINDLIFDGTIDTTDRILVPTGMITPLYLQYRAKVGGWCYSYMDPETRKNMYETIVSLQPGMAFWYDRRGTTPMTIRFK